ncbi:MAG TPA: prenyltransferase [Candidatus Bathyarchaeota archaeon]|nr:prenyltransferase [Candidatus Bathyarchaeota archaeon]
MPRLKVWLLETRPNFLLLTPITYSVGLASALIQGYSNPLNALLGLLGALLAHISVNVLNDYYDYKSGLDLRTRRTPFSGGSGILPEGLLNPEKVYILGLSTLFLGLLIGVYFLLTLGLGLLLILIPAALSVYFYTTHLSRWYVGEFFAGLNFGPLMALGAYYLQAGHLDWTPFIAGVIPGILVGTLLFLNEFPDVEADLSVGRRNFVIFLGRRRASRVYALLIISVYLYIISTILLGLLPETCILSLITAPIAYRAIRGALTNYDDMEALIPAMASNVLVVLSTSALTALGLALALLL